MTSVIQSRSPGAEAFRHLGTSLFYSGNGQSARRILVTSPSAGDGKTSIAANLAITLAHQRHRVLLVDCDAYGKLHTIFQVPEFPGLSEVVLNGTHPAHAIHPSGVSGLSIMASGRLQERATDVIGSGRMRAMLRDLGQEFDLVILDCSPVLGLADSTILSVNSDVVLLVVRAAHTASTAAVEAMRHLSTVGARVAGVVLNDPEERARQYDSYHYDYSYSAR
jgi:capsular exopolysaccharide synthesis family protein